MPDVWEPDETGIARAAGRLAAGGLVGVPTETVYGLAADASNGEAVARVFEAKGRPSFNPLIVHVSDLQEAERFGVVWNETQWLMEEFWPGPLTLVLELEEGAPVADLATAGLGTVALRSPAHPVARALLAAAGPFVAPSANRSGGVSPTRAEHVVRDLPDVPVLDGGPCRVGVESTIVSMVGSLPVILRPGAITTAQVEEVAGRIGAPGTNEVQAPGMLASHYAPHSAVRLRATSAREGEVYLAFGRAHGSPLNLSPGGDLAEAAANLFAMLRVLDGRAPVIAVAPIPEDGIGLAINDRLRRAAAPRPGPRSGKGSPG